MEPLVSVIMSVYNGEKYLRKAIDSILKQTYKNIEFIIIDDGSKDSSLSIIEQYIQKDKRLYVIENCKNRGLIYSLNKGIEKASGKYIARMDADDISLHNRIEEQVRYMENNEDVAMSGASTINFLENLCFIKKVVKSTVKYEVIKAESLFKCSFAHPTVIIRRDILNLNKLRYEEKYKYAEDFALWSNIIPKYKVANIDKQLLKYRVVRTSITRQANKNEDQRADVFKRIYRNYFNNLGYKICDEDLIVHFEIAMIQNISKWKYSLKEKERYLTKLSDSIHIEYIKEICAKQYLKNCIYQGCYNDYKNSLFYNVYKTDKTQYFKVSMIEKVKKIIKKMYK